MIKNKFDPNQSTPKSFTSDSEKSQSKAIDKQVANLPQELIDHTHVSASPEAFRSLLQAVPADILQLSAPSIRQQILSLSPGSGFTKESMPKHKKDLKRLFLRRYAIVAGTKALISSTPNGVLPGEPLAMSS